MGENIRNRIAPLDQHRIMTIATMRPDGWHRRNWQAWGGVVRSISVTTGCGGSATVERSLISERLKRKPLAT